MHRDISVNPLFSLSQNCSRCPVGFWESREPPCKGILVGGGAPPPSQRSTGFPRQLSWNICVLCLLSPGRKSLPESSRFKEAELAWVPPCRRKLCLQTHRAPQEHGLSLRSLSALASCDQLCSCLYLPL